MSKKMSFIIFVAGLVATGFMYPSGDIEEVPNYKFRMLMSILLFVFTITITLYYGKRREDEDDDDKQ